MLTKKHRNTIMTRTEKKAEEAYPKWMTVTYATRGGANSAAYRLRHDYGCEAMVRDQRDGNVLVYVRKRPEPVVPAVKAKNGTKRVYGSMSLPADAPAPIKHPRKAPTDVVPASEAARFLTKLKELSADDRQALIELLDFLNKK